MKTTMKKIALVLMALAFVLSLTGCGMGAALVFSLALTRLLKGDEAADKLFAAVLAK